MLHQEQKKDKFGLDQTDHIHEFMVLVVVALMLIGIFAKVVFF